MDERMKEDLEDSQVDCEYPPGCANGKRLRFT